MVQISDAQKASFLRGAVIGEPVINQRITRFEVRIPQNPIGQENTADGYGDKLANVLGSGGISVYDAHQKVTITGEAAKKFARLVREGKLGKLAPEIENGEAVLMAIKDQKDPFDTISFTLSPGAKFNVDDIKGAVGQQGVVAGPSNTFLIVLEHAPKAEFDRLYTLGQQQAAAQGKGHSPA